MLVFAAASLTEAFGELEAAFEAANPGIDLVLNLGSSSALRTQIEDGAPADVFASANLEHMQTLVESNLVDPDSVAVFASNEIVVILPASNPAAVYRLEDLASPGVRIVLALPEVPAGSYARLAIAALEEDLGPGYERAVLGNLVSSEDSVRQVLLKVELGEADAGFVYRTDALASQNVELLEIPASLRPAVSYTIGRVVDARNQSAAQRFLEFVLSMDGARVLNGWGFSPPPLDG